MVLRMFVFFQQIVSLSPVPIHKPVSFLLCSPPFRLSCELVKETEIWRRLGGQLKVALFVGVWFALPYGGL